MLKKPFMQTQRSRSQISLDILNRCTMLKSLKFLFAIHTSNSEVPGAGGGGSLSLTPPGEAYLRSNLYVETSCQMAFFNLPNNGQKIFLKSLS